MVRRRDSNADPLVKWIATVALRLTLTADQTAASLHTLVENPTVGRLMQIVGWAVVLPVLMTTAVQVHLLTRIGVRIADRRAWIADLRVIVALSIVPPSLIVAPPRTTSGTGQ